MTTLFSEQHADRVDRPDRLPPGQRLTDQWPILTYGATPQIEQSEWRLQVWGAVEQEVEWDWEQFLALGVEKRTNDIHCVTHWSRYDNNWEGVLIATILEQARPKAGAASGVANKKIVGKLKRLVEIWAARGVLTKAETIKDLRTLLSDMEAGRYTPNAEALQLLYRQPPAEERPYASGRPYLPLMRPPPP